MSRALALVAFLSLALIAEPAGAQFITIGFDDGTKVLASYSASGTAQGGVTVQFHGAPEAGCAGHGTCDTSGTITWRPSEEVTVALLRVERKGARSWTGAMTIGGGGPDEPPVTVVTHRGDATCLDQVARSGTFTDVGAGKQHVPIALLGRHNGAFSLVSRCAGPSVGDIARALPTLRPSPAQLRHGTRLDFSGTRAFSSRGYSGTVVSDLVLTTKGAHRDRPRNASPGLPGETPVEHRYRSLDVVYRIAAVSGELQAVARGEHDGACRALDACAAHSTITARPGPAGGSAFLYATTSNARARISDLLGTLGLGRMRRHLGGIRTFGGAFMRPGTTTQELVRPDGSSCHDTLGGTALIVSIGRVGRGFRATVGSGGENDPLRTRCPGPLTGSHELASATIPRSAFGARRLTLRLGGEHRFIDDGWSVHTYSTLRVTLERTRIRPRSEVFTELF